MRTDSRVFTITVIGFAVLFSLFLMSCGSDSDGGSGVSYSGVKTQAAIDDTNAEELSRGAYENGEFGSVLSEIRPGASLAALSGTASLSPRLLMFVRTIEDIANEMVLPVAPPASTYKAVQSGKFEDDGTCGGHVSAEVTVDDSAGTYSAKIIFDNFCEGGDILDGKLRMNGTFAADGKTFFTLVFSFNLTYQSNDESFALQGSIDIGYESDQAVMIMDVLLQDNSGKIYWIENYAWTVIDYGTHSTVEISGRFYHPDHGYVDITTTEPFVINADEDRPSSGVMVVTGSNNTKARLTVLSADAYRVEVDTGDGNGYVPVIP